MEERERKRTHHLLTFLSIDSESVGSAVSGEGV